MKQANAGVAPADLDEVHVMTVWPSIATFWLGRKLGEYFGIKSGFYIFTVGHFVALASIPLALVMYFFRLAPSFFGAAIHGSFYKLTNRRLIVLRSEVNTRSRFPYLKFTYGAEVKSVDLDRFDCIEIVRRPGMEWYDAGDLVFKRGDVETFRLDAVSRPEAFRHTCWKSHMSYVGVKRALDREAVPA